MDAAASTAHEVTARIQRGFVPQTTSVQAFGTKRQQGKRLPSAQNLAPRPVPETTA